MSRAFSHLRFWTFVRRRQQAWAAKHGLAPAVKDPVIARARFTNVFRALDRGTLFSVYALLPLGPADRVWSVLMYRIMNRIDSYLALASGRGPFEREAFLAKVDRWRMAGRKVFTGAFQTGRAILPADGRPAPWPPMDERLASYGASLQMRAGMLAPQLAAARGLEHAVALVRHAVPSWSLSPFPAHQAALDLQYATTFWPDVWVHVGPGAKKGLKMLGMRPTLGALEDLALTQPEIPYAPRLAADPRPALLRLPDVEHALCEWMKYERIKAGGHMRGAYVPTTESLWFPPSPVPPWWRLP